MAAEAAQNNKVISELVSELVGTLVVGRLESLINNFLDGYEN